MGEDSSYRLEYFLKLKKSDKEQLGSIRHWEHLKVAIDKEDCWVKGFTENQIHSIVIKQLPFKEIFYVKAQRLFPFGKKLPIGKAPSFLWTPIARAIPVSLPIPNPNFFGIEEKIGINLVPSDVEKEGIASLLLLKNLKAYIETAPAIRLRNLSWVILNQSKALVIGTPLLPLPGTVFWKDNKFLLPLGYRFDLPILSQFINKKINPDSENWVLWNTEGSYNLIPQDMVKPLSLSSFRQSV